MGLWGRGVAGGVLCCFGAATIGLAVETTDQSPQPPSRNWQIGFTPSYATGNFGTSSTRAFSMHPYPCVVSLRTAT